MEDKVLILHIGYEGLEDKIWRIMTIPCEALWLDLACAILTTFDAKATHAFEFNVNGKVIPLLNQNNMLSKEIRQPLYIENLKVGLELSMIYDYGVSHVFKMKVLDIADNEDDELYPLYVLEGEGRGFLEDVFPEEMEKIIKEIDEQGRMKKPIYYKDENIPWDYRKYDFEEDNEKLKGETIVMVRGYKDIY